MPLLRRLLAVLIIISFLANPLFLHAEPKEAKPGSGETRETGPQLVDPNDPRFIPVKLIRQLKDWENPFTWFLISLIVTYNRWNALKTVWKDLRAQQAALVAELEKQNLSFEKKKQIAEELNRLFIEWETLDSTVEKNLKELEEHVNVVRRMNHDKRRHFLKSDEGKAWNRKLETLIDPFHKEIPEKYNAIFYRANELFPAEHFHMDDDTLKRPSHWKGVTPHYLQHEESRRRKMSNHVAFMKTHCQKILGEMAGEISALAAKTKLQWNTGKNWARAAAFVAGLSGVVGSWIWSEMKWGKPLDELQSDVAKRNQMNMQAELDLAGQIGSESGKIKLQPFARIIKETLKAHKSEIKDSLIRRITYEEIDALQKSGVTIDSLVNLLDSDSHVQAALESATTVAGKHIAGDRAVISMLENYIYPQSRALKDTARVEFIHKFYVTFFDKLWPKLSNAGASRRIEDAIFNSLEQQTIEKLDRTNIEPPPSPPGPGLRLAPEPAEKTKPSTPPKADLPTQPGATKGNAVSSSKTTGDEEPQPKPMATP